MKKILAVFAVVLLTASAYAGISLVQIFDSKDMQPLMRVTESTYGNPAAVTIASALATSVVVEAKAQPAITYSISETISRALTYEIWTRARAGDSVSEATSKTLDSKRAAGVEGSCGILMKLDGPKVYMNYGLQLTADQANRFVVEIQKAFKARRLVRQKTMADIRATSKTIVAMKMQNRATSETVRLRQQQYRTEAFAFMARTMLLRSSGLTSTEKNRLQDIVEKSK
jgi:hypothetical protein